MPIDAAFVSSLLENAGVVYHGSLKGSWIKSR